ncbi:TATA element modulatory factor-like isoform X3 [Ptychodera flava]|uniref:TATA element modulatory factor-like isoform X3 n=1 Tax=Ptychodera flava TaxID=63121 RepID=UPI00396A0E62
MSWFDSAGLTNFAKSALTNAQKSIDKVLDIQEDEDEQSSLESSSETKSSDKVILEHEAFQAHTEYSNVNDADDKSDTDDADDNAFLEEEEVDFGVVKRIAEWFQMQTEDPSPSSGKAELEKKSETTRNRSTRLSGKKSTPKSRNSSTDGESFWGAFLDTSTEEELSTPKKSTNSTTGSAFTRKGFGFGLAGKVWGSSPKQAPQVDSEKETKSDERTKQTEDVAKQQGDVESSSQKSTKIELEKPSGEHTQGDATKEKEKPVEAKDEVDSGREKELKDDSVREVELKVYEGSEDIAVCEKDVESEERQDAKRPSDDGRDEGHSVAKDEGQLEEIPKQDEKTQSQADNTVPTSRGTDEVKSTATDEESSEKKDQKITTEEHIEKKEHDKERGHDGDTKSDHSSEGHTTDDQGSSKSDSDFVVISDVNGSAPSTNISGSSPESASPRHYPICPGNGKRSPSDSEFSVISEEKVQESVHFDASSDTDIPAMLADASINISQRTSPTDTSSSDIPKYSSGEEGSLKESADDEEEDGDYMNKTLTQSAMKTSAGPSLPEASAEKDDVMNRSQEDSSASVDSVKEVQIGTSTDSMESQEKDSLPADQQQDTAEVEHSTEGKKFDPEEALKSEKLLKDSDGETVSVKSDRSDSGEKEQSENLLEKLAEMAEVLQARENKVLTLSKENMDLSEDNNILRSQLKQSEDAREAEMEDLNVLTEEFTQRLTTMEKKLQSITKERDMMKKEVHLTYQQLQDKSNDEKFARILEEKDEQIEGLMQEGEKLSKQQLQNSNIIKKLRVKEKENETLIKSLKKQLEDSQKEATHLREVLDAKEEIDKKQKDGISKLNTAVEKQEKQIIILSSDLEDAKEKVRSTQSALDASYKEIAELHRTIASKDSKIQEAQLSAEMSAKEETRFALERAQQEAKHEQEGLAMQVNDLRMSLTRAEQQYARKEDNLRQEILDLQQRLQEAEYRNQELSQSVTAATRPLLRQIENLQSTFTTQSSSWERVERSLTERLNEAQTQLAGAMEKERMVNENTMEMNSKLASLESQVMMLRQEKMKLTAQLEVEKSKVESLEDYKNKEAIQLDTVRSTYSKAIEDLERDKALLEKQVEMERLKVDTERKKLMLAQEALKDKEKKVEELSLHVKVNSRPETPVMSRSDSFTSETLSSTPVLPIMPLTQGEILEQSMSATMTGSMYESMISGSATAIIESLQSQVKQRDGEIVQLQSTITQLERTRASMAEELVNLSNSNESLETKVAEIPEMQRIRNAAKTIGH